MHADSKRRKIAAFIPLVLALLAVGGCDSSDDGMTEPGTIDGLDPNVPPMTTGDWYRPAHDATWHYQLRLDNVKKLAEDAAGGSLEIIVISLRDGTFIPEIREALGLSEFPKFLCHFAAGALASGDPGYSSLPEPLLGDAVAGAPDLRWVDVRSEQVLEIALVQLERATAVGCDGVVPAYVDGHLHATGLGDDAIDWLAFNRHLANAAHQLFGLAVLLKNNGAQGADLYEYYDGHLVENCFSVTDCYQTGSTFLLNSGPILNAELVADEEEGLKFQELYCPESISEGIQTLIAPRELDGSFAFDCLTPDMATVSISPGSSVPGCETTSDCYDPSSVTIGAGGTVNWNNDDTASHTVTSGTPAAGPNGAFASSLLESGSSFDHTFDTAGAFPYYCQVHPWMVGEVVVTA